MTASTKTLIILAFASAVIYFLVLFYAHKKHKRMLPYVFCFLLNVLAIWEFYAFSKINPDSGTDAGLLASFYKYAAIALPMLALLLLIYQSRRDASPKSTFTPDYQGQDLPAKFPVRFPGYMHKWLDRGSIFFYKVLVWLYLGVVIGVFFAEIQGFMPIWVMIVHIFGSIGVGWVLVLIFLEDQFRRNQYMFSAQGHLHDQSRAYPARIETIHSGGIRIMETHEQLIITLLVLPGFERPYQTTIRQFMVAEDMDQLQEGALITFYEDAHDRGYGTLAPKFPVGADPAAFKSFKADKVYPQRSGTGLWLLFGRHPTPFRRSVSLILITLIFGMGFLSPYIVSGNMEWLGLKIKHFPQKIIFQNKGNFNPDAFKKAYDKAIAFIGDQRIESLLFYKEFTAVSLVKKNDPKNVRSATIRGNSVSGDFIKWRVDEHDRLFKVQSITYEILKKALDDAATDNNIKDIMYIGFRKDTRWGSRRHHIAPDYKRHYVDIHIVFNGGGKSLHYNGQTGERFPE